MKAIFKGEITRSARLSNIDGKTADQQQQKIYFMKGLGSGKPLTDEQLAKINTYARKPLTMDQVAYVPLLMAHNGIDRDTERFNEELLAEFSQKLPGKGFFVEGHPGGWGGSGGPGEGLHFDARVQQMTPAEFKTLTDEDIKLPDGVSTVHALMSDAYVLALPSNADTRAKIDAGIIRYSSIGFKAPFYSITDDNGNHIYGEYRPKGEALEGSLVWLGAQPGAGIMKSAGAEGGPEQHEEKSEEEESKSDRRIHMKILVQRLSKELGQAFTVENLGDEIIAYVAGVREQMEAMKAKAADGDEYRAVLVEDTIHYGAMVGEIQTIEATQRKEADFIKTWPLVRIKALRDKYEGAARKMYPDKFTIQGKEQMDRERAIRESERKAAEAGPQKKDRTLPRNNPLLQV